MDRPVSNTRKLINGVSSQSAVTVVLGVVEIVSFSIMSRLLSQEDFGYYAAVTAITTVFASFSETGIGSALVQRKDLNQRIINNAFTMSLIFGLFISFALFATAGFLSSAVLDEKLKVPLMIMSSTLLCNCLTSVNLSLLQRKLQFLRIGVIQLISIIVTTIVAIILALNGFGFYSIIAKAVLSAWLTLFLSYLFSRPKLGLGIDLESFKSIFGFSGWLMASVFFRNFAQQVDRLLMGRLLSVTSLGAYNRPKEFINQISSKFNGIFDSALFPVLSSVQDNKTSLANAYRLSFYYLNIASMLLALLFVFNHELIIRVFLGEQWMNIKLIFVILSLSLIFNIDGRLSDCFLRSLGLTRAQFFFRIVELILEIVALFIGAKWELVGISIAIILVSFLMIVIKTHYIAKWVGVSLSQTISIILNSWQFTIVILPVLIFLYYLLPHSIVGNILLAGAFIVLCIVVFLVFPNLVGGRYANEAYERVLGYVKEIMRKLFQNNK